MSGTDGNDQPAAAPDGEISVEITAQAPEPMGSPSLARDIGNAIAGLLGIGTANAGSVSVLVDNQGKSVGFIMFSPGIVPFRGVNLVALLLGLGGYISLGGTISGPGIVAGQVNGRVNGGISVYDNTVDAVDLNNQAAGMTMTGSSGESLALGYYSGPVWAMLNSFLDPATGDKITLKWPAQRKWSAAGPNSSIGVPIMSAADELKMFSGQLAHLFPEFVGGRLNATTGYGTIASLRYGTCAVPAAGAPGAVFDFGSSATYGVSYVLLAADAQGRIVILGSASEAINVLNPQTGAAFGPVVSYAWMWVADGSQACGLWGQPSYQYNGPKPSAADPMYNSAIPGVIGVSDTMVNTAIMTETQYAAYVNPSGNPGGPG